MDSTVRTALAEAMAVLREETSLDAGALFGERIVEPTQMSPRAAHAVGVIEGAAILAGMTALELLDEVLLTSP